MSKQEKPHPKHEHPMAQEWERIQKEVETAGAMCINEARTCHGIQFPIGRSGVVPFHPPQRSCIAPAPEGGQSNRAVLALMQVLEERINQEAAGLIWRTGRIRDSISEVTHD